LQIHFPKEGGILVLEDGSFEVDEELAASGKGARLYEELRSSFRQKLYIEDVHVYAACPIEVDICRNISQ
jgi:hypothetical protein